MPDSTTAPNHQLPVEVAHAISGRLRLRLVGGERTTQRLDALSAALEALRARRGIRDVELTRAARGVIIRYAPDLLDQDRVLALAEAAGLVRPTTRGADEPDGASSSGSETTEELTALLGIPTSFNRHLAESLALSGASLLAARHVGTALGGGLAVPTYFAVWLALRRVTGLGRRR